MEITRDLLIATKAGEDMSDEGWKARVLDRQRHEFEEHGDPLLPWNALSMAQFWKLPVPEWVLDYLSGRAERLNQIVLEGGGNGSKEAELVGRALGFGAAGKGGTAAGKTIRSRDRNYRIAFHVICEVEKAREQSGREDMEAAKKEAATYFGVSASTVNRAFDEWRTVAEQHVADLIAHLKQS